MSFIQLKNKKLIEEKLEINLINKLNKGQSLDKYIAIYRDQKVVLRIFTNNDYYGDRFKREKIGLETMFRNRSNLNFRVPEIIKEWENYKIRAIEWIDHTEVKINLVEIWQSINDLEVNLDYDFTTEMYNHLTDTSWVHTDYKAKYQTLSNKVLKDFNWINEEIGVLHGDFHPQNILYSKTENIPIIIDWEYFSYGPRIFDLAYYSYISGNDTSSVVKLSELRKWEKIVALSFLHWELSQDNPNHSNINVIFEQLKSMIN